MGNFPTMSPRSRFWGCQMFPSGSTLWGEGWVKNTCSLPQRTRLNPGQPKVGVFRPSHFGFFRKSGNLALPAHHFWGARKHCREMDALLFLFVFPCSSIPIDHRGLSGLARGERKREKEGTARACHQTGVHKPPPGALSD